MRHFGKHLKQLRRQLGKTQIEVVSEINQQYADCIRMSQTTLSSLEQRETLPSGRILKVLAEYYGVPAASFFDVEQAPLPDEEWALIRAWRLRDYSYILEMVANKLREVS